MSTRVPPRIYVLAGVNGAGKSSIAGAAFREQGGDYYNPDEAARQLRTRQPALSQTDANSRAWHTGRALLEEAIAARLDYAFETTLGASTIPRLLAHAAAQGIEVRVWYAGLATPASRVVTMAVVRTHELTSPLTTLLLPLWEIVPALLAELCAPSPASRLKSAILWPLPSVSTTPPAEFPRAAVSRMPKCGQGTWALAGSPQRKNVFWAMS